MAEQTSGAARSAVDKVASGQGISAFLGRLLDQLSLSAWFPAAMLVGSFAVLLQLRTQQNRSLVEAVTKLANRPLGLLILLVFALVLATMVTQAFEFEVIRLLEGYWGNGLVAKAISRPFVSWQRDKYDRLVQKQRELRLRAFRRTKSDLIRKGIVRPNQSYMVDIIEEDLKAEVDTGSPTSPSGWRAKWRAREARKVEWEPFAPADLVGRIQAVEQQIKEYPEPSRLLPTKLGNVLRSAEDSLGVRGGDLESFVVRHWDEIPDALRKEHDQYRTRLDLYCMLVFVFFVLGVVAPALITRGSSYLISTVATSVGYLFMSFVSYGAAVASARGFGSALKAIGAREYSDQARSRRLGRS